MRVASLGCILQAQIRWPISSHYLIGLFSSGQTEGIHMKFYQPIETDLPLLFGSLESTDNKRSEISQLKINKL